MGGEEYTVLVLRLMHKLAMSHMRKVLKKEKRTFGTKIPHTGDNNSLDRCG